MDEQQKSKIMNKEDKMELGSVQETMLLPLWGRAVETKKSHPLLIDNTAVTITDSIPYDFSVIAKNVSRISRLSWIARSIYFDKNIKAFIADNPDATIVNVGCGLDTTFDRVDNGKIHWIDLDLPDTIALRKKYIQESDRRTFVPASALDTDWYEYVENADKVMFMIAGVIYYFNETEIKKMFYNFHNYAPGVEVVFDYESKIGMKNANKFVIKGGGMDKSAYLKWGINNIFDIEKWNSNIEIISDMPLFSEFKNKFHLFKRLGMSFCDSMKIMSLAHIRIK